MIVDSTTEIIFMSCIKKYNIISEITIPMSKTGPAGLGTFGFPGLWKSTTTLPFLFRYLIKGGVIKNMTRKETADTIIP